MYALRKVAALSLFALLLTGGCPLDATDVSSYIASLATELSNYYQDQSDNQGKTDAGGDATDGKEDGADDDAYDGADADKYDGEYDDGKDAADDDKDSGEYDDGKGSPDSGDDAAYTDDEFDADGEASFGATDGLGAVTFQLAGGDFYRMEARDGAGAENLTEALDALAPRMPDEWVNPSPDGKWLLLSTERFDPAVAGYAGLALVAGDLSSGAIVRAAGEVVHSSGRSAVSNDGRLIVFDAGGGPHVRDLWAIRDAGAGFGAPVLLTADSPFAFQALPAISADGKRVVFEAGDEPYAAEGTGLCEVNTDGTGFTVVLTPADSPDGLPKTGALHNPAYDPAGGIVFEADWDGERIWRLPAGETTPRLVGRHFHNDNSPSVLPDGRIVSLWLDRPGGSGAHEMKVMSADGSEYFILLFDEDVADGSLGCGG